MSSRRSSRRSATTTPLVCINPPRVGRNATCVSLSLPVIPKNLACFVCTPKLDGTAVRKQCKRNETKSKQNRCRQPWHDYWLNHQKMYVKFREEVRVYLCLPIDKIVEGGKQYDISVVYHSACLTIQSSQKLITKK